MTTNSPDHVEQDQPALRINELEYLEMASLNVMLTQGSSTELTPSKQARDGAKIRVNDHKAIRKEHPIDA